MLSSFSYEYLKSVSEMLKFAYKTLQSGGAARTFAQLGPWHQPSRAGVSTIFTWRASGVWRLACVRASHSLARPPSNLES